MCLTGINISSDIEWINQNVHHMGKPVQVNILLVLHTFYVTDQPFHD